MPVYLYPDGSVVSRVALDVICIIFLAINTLLEFFGEKSICANIKQILFIFIANICFAICELSIFYNISIDLQIVYLKIISCVFILIFQ